MKRIIYFAAIVFLLTVIANLSFSIVTLWSKRDVLTQAQSQLIKEQEEQRNLKKQWKQVNSPNFVEQQARDKLFLGKPGESLVLIPTASPSAVQQQSASQEPVLEQWWKLFF